jgi:cell division protein ZapA
MKEKKPVTVEIFGQQYTLRGDAEERYVQDLARFVDKKIREVAAHAKVNDPGKLAILSAINIAHDYFQLREDQQHHHMAIRQIGRKTRDIIDSIEGEFDDLHLH